MTIISLAHHQTVFSGMAEAEQIEAILGRCSGGGGVFEDRSR